MYFSATTIALVATVGFGVLPGQVAAVPAEDHSIAERSLFGNWWAPSQNLCDKPKYGAVGNPWDNNSKPGAWCGGNKPSNSGQWAQLPLWDGGDAVKCKSIFSKFGLNICYGGNKKVQLPWGCRPPKSKPSKPKPSAKPSTSAASSAAASSAAATSSAAGASSAVASPSATTSSAAAPSPSDDPYENPVCDLTYQVQYLDYKIVAPNGYWMGQTVGSATQDSSYMTYTLANTVDDCLRACDQIEGCTFVNTYYDTNEQEEDLPKHAPGVLTCAMFSKCVSTDQNDNFGGQDDPNQIYQSNGYCKSGACGV